MKYTFTVFFTLIYALAHVTSQLVMYLRLSLFLKLSIGYFLLPRIISIHGKQYSQNDIDNAFVKMIKKERFYRPLDNQLGCWPQNVIPYRIHAGFSKYISC